MKRRIALCLIVSCMATTLWGCIGSSEVLSRITEEKGAEKEAETTEEEETSAGADASAGAEEETTPEKGKSSDAPMLGDEDIEGYEGFTYLYDEIIRTNSEENKETGKMERKELTVYIPKADYTSVNSGYATSTDLGVEVYVELEPHLGYSAEEHLLGENLESYIESEFDPFYNSDYKDVVKGEIEELDAHSVMATVEYCWYNSWDESYTSVFETYFLTEIGDKTVLVNVAVNEKDVTGKTPMLIKELEAFYGFPVNWDADRAEEKRLNYEAIGGDNTYSTGYMMFELPEGWSQDKQNSDYGRYIYAPGGDFEYSSCMILMMDDYVSSGETIPVEDMINSKDEAGALVGEMMGIEVNDFDVESADTCLGEAAKLSYSVTVKGQTAICEMYYIPGDYEVYMIYAMQLSGAEEDAFAILADIMENGQVKES